MYKNKLLIANPIITDPVFSGTAIFLFEHSKKKGAMGVILNSKEVGKVGFGSMQDLFNAAPGSFNETKNMILNGKLQSVPLFLGGPCQTPGIYFLHAYEEFLNMLEGPEEPEFDLGIPASFNLFDDEQPAYQDAPANKMSVMDGLYFGTPYTFGHIIESGKLDEDKFRFFTGQSSWQAGQLENEIAGGAWTVVEDAPFADLFFDRMAVEALVRDIAKTKPAPAPPQKKKSGWTAMPKLPPGFDPSWN